MELIPVHDAPYDYNAEIKRQCCQILNDEWPRSETLRLRSLESSREDLPMCLALVQWFNAGKAKEIRPNCSRGNLLVVPIKLYTELQIQPSIFR